MFENWLRLDFETRSYLDIFEYGLYNYITHFSTEPLMLGYKYGREPEASLHEFRFGSLPNDLYKALKDPNQMLTAFNSAFERGILQYCLGIKIPAERFHDPQASSRYLSLPADLETVGEVLHLPSNLQKDKKGHDLIKLFSEPKVTRKVKNEIQKAYFNDWDSHPVEWKLFCEYCKQDVIAEEEVARRLNMLDVFPLPEKERKIWIFDQKVNDRGIPVSQKFIESALEAATEAKRKAVEAGNILTGLENSNSPSQLLPWARMRGYPRGTLRKDVVDLILKDPDVHLTETCRTVLEKRKEASSTTYKKLTTMLRQIGSDGRLRNQFIYRGSSRCGRWSSGASQLHNMARPAPEFESIEYLDWARAMVYAKDFDSINNWFGSILLTIKSLIRTVFEAPAGCRFSVCDVNAIETRVGAWVAQCEALLNVFISTPEQPKGRDPYLDFGVKMTGIPYEKLLADYKSKVDSIKAAAKAIRQMAKPGVLGAIYRLAGGMWGWSKKSYKDHALDCDASELNESGKKIGKKDCKCPEVRDRVKTGLWGYAENMGISLTEKESNEVVRVFRNTYTEICGTPNYSSGFPGGIWYVLENAVKDVLHPDAKNVIRTVGPNGCVKIDKLVIRSRGNVLRIQLPSGSRLHYIDARIQEVEMPWEDREGNKVFKPALVYSGVNQETKQWENSITSHGGKIFENIVQGIARDILAEKLLLIDELGIEIVAHVHDEGVGLTEDNPLAPGHREMEKIMGLPIDWAPGLPLAAEGFDSKYYHK
jgi:DNA polymerase